MPFPSCPYWNSCGEGCETSGPPRRARSGKGAPKFGTVGEVSGRGDQEDCQRRKPGAVVYGVAVVIVEDMV